MFPKVSLTIICTLFVSFYISAQDIKHDINVEYLPQSMYSFITKVSTKTIISQILNDEAKKSLDSMGLLKKYKTRKASSLKSYLITKTREDKGFIPMKYTSYDFKGVSQGKRLVFPHDTLKIVGYINKYNKISVEDVYKDNESIKEDAPIRRGLYEATGRYPFLKGGMMVGDSFKDSGELMYFVPIEQSDEHNFELLFTLVKVKNGIAYFDLEALEPDLIETEYKLINNKISGKGSMEVNLKFKYVRTLKMNYSLTVIEEIYEGYSRKHEYEQKISIKTNYKEIR